MTIQSSVIAHKIEHGVRPKLEALCREIVKADATYAKFAAGEFARELGREIADAISESIDELEAQILRQVDEKIQRAEEHRRDSLSQGLSP